MEFNTPALNKIKPQDYCYYGLWKEELFSACFWVNCYSHDLIRKLDLKLDGLSMLALCQGHVLVRESECTAVQGQIKDKILSGDSKFFKNAVQIADEACNHAVEVVERLRDDRANPDSLRQFYEIARSVNFLWHLGVAHFVVAVEEMLQKQAAKESYPAEAVPRLVPTLKTPLYYQGQEVAKLKKLVGERTLAEVRQAPDIYKQLEEHVKKYAWIETSNFIGEPLTVKRLYEQIIHANLSTGSATPPATKPSSTLQFRAQCMHDMGYVKQLSAEYFSMITAMMMPFLRRVASKLGIGYRELILLRDDEVLDGTAGKLSLETIKEIVEMRKTHEWAIFRDESNTLVFCDDTHDLATLKEVMLPSKGPSKEVRGQVGNPGKATGVVKVVMNLDEFHKMNTGDVLVTTMTTPDFVIVMQKSSAIVTDIGGLLCHAAIVSRELKKPCIIGTKNATRILKDGDVVEVDADRGTIKILKTTTGSDG